MQVMKETGKKLTKADLVFIDASIQLLRASQAPQAAGASVLLSNPVACDTVDLAAAVVAVAVYAYHVYNSCLIGEDNAFLERGRALGLAPKVSLDKLISTRNALAKELGE